VTDATIAPPAPGRPRRVTRISLALEARPEPSRLMAWLSPVVAAVAVFVVGFVLFSSLGKNPFAAFYVFFVKPIDSIYGVGELLLKASPLMLCAIGLAAGYRANVWNIGAEGQLTFGAIAGGGVALAFQDQGGAWLLPLMLVAGAVGGMVWAAIPAWLRTRFNANEILVSLMLVYVAKLALSWLVHGPWRDPEGFNFPQSTMFADAALLPNLIPETRLNVGFMLALAAIAFAWVFMQRSLMGFQMRVAGLAPAAANYAGISGSRTVWLGMLIGGATAGIAGVNEAAGPIGQLLPSMSPGYGFAAIIVAFVGRLQPLGILLASLLMSLLYLGGEAAQIGLALPSAITGLFQGLLLFFLLAADVFINFRLRLHRRTIVSSVAVARRAAGTA
jgi:general nucleoside transport system permease protein